MRLFITKTLLWFGGGAGCGILALVLYFLPQYSLTIGGIDMAPLAAMVIDGIGLACVGWAIFGFTKGNVPTRHPSRWRTTQH
jgi:hypothetical protein